MTDIRLICAERRAEDMLTVLTAALRGDPHWRRDAKALLADIDKTTYPEPLTEAERERLCEIDARKRAAEILHDKLADAFAQQCASEDVCHGA